MVNGVTFNRSTKTADKKLTEMLAKKWEHEAVQTVVYEGERPVTLYEAINSFLEVRKHKASYVSARQYLRHWKDVLLNVKMKALTKAELKAVANTRLAEGAPFITVSNKRIDNLTSARTTRHALLLSSHERKSEINLSNDSVPLMLKTT